MTAHNPHTTASVVPPTPDGVRVSDTAGGRFVAHVRPGLPTDVARDELQRLPVEHWNLVEIAPHGNDRQYFALIADLLCLPLAYHHHHDRWAATTCLVAGTLTDRQARGRRDRRRRRRRRAR